MSTGPPLVRCIGDSHRRAIQAQSDGRAVDIELGVVEIGEHHVVHAVWPGATVGIKTADQQSRDRRIAVGEMVNVGLVECRDFRILEVA